MKQITPPELAARARIAGAQLLPLRELAGRLDELDQAKDIVAICHHGGRSLQGAAFLEKNGYNKIHNLVGGVDGWSRTVDPAVPIY
jgi:rhodanese-related sulfurtransferase